MVTYSSKFLVKKRYFYFITVGDAPLVTLLMQYKLKMLQFIPNAPSTFLWVMNDAHSRMIHSFESILFKGLIKFKFKFDLNWSTIK